MNSKVYKWCAVPLCKNTSIATPNKLFVYVPNKKIVRDKWLTLARRNPADVVTNSPIYFCEDHFDLPNDMENYMQYHLMGSVSQVRMKLGCIPKKFECQQIDGKTRTSIERPYIRKKRKMMVLEECEKQLEESSMVTEHFHFEEIASGSSGKTSDKPQTSVDSNTADYTDITSKKNATKHSTTKDAPPEREKYTSQKSEIKEKAESFKDFTEVSLLPIEPESSHAEYECNECHKGIVGFRYTCVQCPDWDLCGVCEARTAHATHYVLRVPSPRPYNEIQAVLKTIRQQLLRKNSFSNQEPIDDSLLRKVKVEPPEAQLEPDAIGNDSRRSTNHNWNMQTEYKSAESDANCSPRHKRPSIDASVTVEDSVIEITVYENDATSLTKTLVSDNPKNSTVEDTTRSPSYVLDRDPDYPYKDTTLLDYLEITKLFPDNNMTNTKAIEGPAHKLPPTTPSAVDEDSVTVIRVQENERKLNRTISGNPNSKVAFDKPATPLVNTQVVPNCKNFTKFLIYNNTKAESKGKPPKITVIKDPTETQNRKRTRIHSPGDPTGNVYIKPTRILRSSRPTKKIVDNFLNSAKANPHMTIQPVDKVMSLYEQYLKKEPNN